MKKNQKNADTKKKARLSKKARGIRRIRTLHLAQDIIASTITEARKNKVTDASKISNLLVTALTDKGFTLKVGRDVELPAPADKETPKKVSKKVEPKAEAKDESQVPVEKTEVEKAAA